MFRHAQPSNRRRKHRQLLAASRANHSQLFQSYSDPRFAVANHTFITYNNPVLDYNNVVSDFSSVPCPVQQTGETQQIDSSNYSEYFSRQLPDQLQSVPPMSPNSAPPDTQAKPIQPEPKQVYLEEYSQGKNSKRNLVQLELNLALKEFGQSRVDLRTDIDTTNLTDTQVQGEARSVEALEAFLSTLHELPHHFEKLLISKEKNKTGKVKGLKFLLNFATQAHASAAHSHLDNKKKPNSASSKSMYFPHIGN